MNNNGAVMQDTKSKDSWRVWDKQDYYGDMLYDRAVGKLPEMESSKALARIVKESIRPDDHILDAGCGAGHYLRSLKNAIDIPFSYTGADATAYYIEMAKKAWHDTADADFTQADIFSLPFADETFDIVISCNVLQHLPSIKIPIQQLVRVAKRKVIIRTFVSDRSFRIQEVYSPETHSDWIDFAPGTEEFDENGEPVNFHYYNIYSESYIRKITLSLPGVQSCKITKDTFYDPQNIANEAETYEDCPDATKIIEGQQVNGPIIQPWHFIEITKK